MNFSALFTPTKIGSLELPNRIAMAPMTRSFSPQHIPTDQVAEYYERRAKGGVGLIITEGTNISSPSSAGYPNVPVMHGEALAGWQKVVDKVHAHSTKIAVQLWHVGALRGPGFDPENQIPSFSPSGVFYNGSDKGPSHEVKTMSLSDIDDVIESFADAAFNAKKVGFDAIELHGAHGYLIDQFFWARTNLRQDKYGGPSYKERSTFAREIVQAVRSQVGPDFPITFRFSNWKAGVYSQQLFETPEQLGEFLEPISSSGITALHASSRRFNAPEFTGSQLNLAGWTKKISGLPTISVGSVGLEKDFITSITEETATASFAELNEKLEKNEFDLIAVGRSLISEPEWANKVQNGHLDQITPFEKKHLAELV